MKIEKILKTIENILDYEKVANHIQTPTFEKKISTPRENKE